MKRLLFIVVSLILLVGCSKSETPSTEETAAFPFVYDGMTIQTGSKAAPVTDALDASDKRLNYFEAPSCAFEGVDKIFYYTGFEIYTYPVDGVDYISSISLVDDSVSTKKGIYLGVGLDKIVEAYGNDYVQELGQYTYTQGKYSLSFLIEEDVVVAITYAFDNL